jgi:hypothetical protein
LMCFSTISSRQKKISCSMSSVKIFDKYRSR